MYSRLFAPKGGPKLLEAGLTGASVVAQTLVTATFRNSPKPPHSPKPHRPTATPPGALLCPNPSFQQRRR